MSTMRKTEVLDDVNRKPMHRKNKSGDLDVFEASVYFSGGMDAAEHDYNMNESQKVMKGEKPNHGRRRRSLDIIGSPQDLKFQEEEKQIKEKRYKQPKSPGARFACFFISLFNQTGYKKKNKKEDKEEITLDTRKVRRNSMSNFYSSRFPKSFDQSSISDPSNTSNELKHLRGHADNRKPETRLCFNEKIKYVTFLHQNASSDDKNTINFVFPEGNVRFFDSMKTKDIVLNNGALKKNGSRRNAAYGNMSFKKKESWNIRSMFDGISSELNLNELEKDEDDAESDSSSDLFELNCVI